MNENVVRLPKVPKMTKQRRPKGASPAPLVELPMPDIEKLTPQELLSKLARDLGIEKCLVIVPKMDEFDDSIEHTHVYQSGMTNAETLFYIEKVKLGIFGFEI